MTKERSDVDGSDKLPRVVGRRAESVQRGGEGGAGRAESEQEAGKGDAPRGKGWDGRCARGQWFRLEPRFFGM